MCSSSGARSRGEDERGRRHSYRCVWCGRHAVVPRTRRLPPHSFRALSGRYLSLAEREGKSRSCAPSTPVCVRSRDVSAARRQRSRASCGATPPRVGAGYVQGPARWPGQVSGRHAGAGPQTSCGSAVGTGRARTRRCATSWSPEQIGHRLRVDFADGESIRISQKAIYRALYVQGRGALRRERLSVLCDIKRSAARHVRDGYVRRDCASRIYDRLVPGEVDPPGAAAPRSEV